ncbi:MAG: DedA family protein [Thermaerobacter sp.]|nr:DedA family protein [Thermaerobacter sp.]
MTTVHLRELLTLYGYPLLFFASAIEGTGLPGPIELFFLAAGFLIARGDMTLFWVWASATAGNVLGNLGGYLIGRWGGRPLFDQVARRMHFKEAGVLRAESWFQNFGATAQAISRLVGVTRTPAILGAGMMRAPLGPFLIGSLVGDGIWAMFWTLAGLGIGRNMPYVRQHEALAITLLVVLLVGGAAVWYLFRRRLTRR